MTLVIGVPSLSRSSEECVFEKRSTSTIDSTQHDPLYTGVCGRQNKKNRLRQNVLVLKKQAGKAPP